MLNDLFDIETVTLLFFVFFIPAQLYLWNKLCGKTHSAPKGPENKTEEVVKA